MEASGQDTVLTQCSRRIMLSSVVILVAACAMVALFHMYSKWCNTRVIQQSTRHPYATATAEAALASKGLDPAVVNALPSFVYESKSRESPLECAVCLSEFEDGEKGRLLPECKHSFHVDCIDMWFQSHSDCPLCRAQVKAEDMEDDPVDLSEDPNEVVISILPMERDDPNQGHGSDSGSELECSTTSLMPEVVPWRSQMGENPYRGVDVSGTDIESGQKTTIGSVKVSNQKGL